jgi:hypothetical protein
VHRNSMKRHLPAFVPALLLAWTTFSCSKTSTVNTDLSGWLGDYEYKEEPVEATQGIYKNMSWHLSIQQQNDTCRGILEILGDQTYIKALTTIDGDSNYVNIVFNKLLEGADENFSEGENLFTITKDKGNLITSWDGMEPRLEEFPPEECTCFTSKKKKKVKAKSKAKKKKR